MTIPTLSPTSAVSSGYQTSLRKVRTVNTFCYLLFLYFILDFFLRFSARIPGYGSFRPTLLAFVAISGLLFIQRDKLKGRFEDPVFKAMFALLIYLAISLPLVEWPGSVLRGNIDRFVLAVAFFFFTALIIDTDSRLRWFLLIFLGCQVFRVLEPLYLNLTQDYWGSSTYLGPGEFADRLAGAPADVINSNELGFVIVTALTFLHYLLWPLGWKSKALYIVLAPAMLYALMLTMSRGSLLALFVVGLMVFKESRHKFGLIILALVLAVVGWSLMSPVQQDRYLSLISTDSESAGTVDGRIGGMKQEFRLGMKRPIVGHGLGTTSEAKFHAYGSTQASHNLYAELMIELGIIGLVIFLRYLWQIYKRLKENRLRFKSIDVGRDDLYSRLNNAMIAVFWMYIVFSFNYWGVSQYYWYLFGGLAIAFGRLLRFQQDKEAAEMSQGQAEDGTRQSPKYPLAQRLRYSKGI